MSGFSPGFKRFHRSDDPRLPPGQFVADGFPVLSAGPTPRIERDTWTFTVTDASGGERRWTWAEYQALAQESPTVDIHCVTRWSKFGTSWRGVPVDAFLAHVPNGAGYAMVESYGGYTTNVPLDDLANGRAWIVHEYDGAPLAPEHGGPARMLIPHLYFWKSAKWVRGIRLMERDEQGFWESLGYHDRGDPWREQRTWGD
ncbi:sulfite oxidase-like oxidoreductase [Yinghuangia soli]|uniref:Sulfite oxidase-like oxidoreductase n=1 Tax=Yinghuangia soli TaxID=2908204 RepID=A0AA41U373_9ACTN|nr:sulfite oxidase-like oxidoreductase [Yinghuangia soli]MCF2531466.1 sulfite oxidase-like oxidoreductase [Yinghuangia soli]